MAKGKSVEISTVIVNGDFDSFKAALTRSILGVTFAKFKRKRSDFYQHRVHNAAITKEICNWLYEYLLTHPKLRLERNLRDFKLRTSLTLNWNETGKIVGLSDVKVFIYSEVAQLTVKELQLLEKPEKIKIDFFFSQIDDASQKLRSILPNMLKSIGYENFDYNEYDFLSEEGKKAAKIFHVDRVPTVVIDGRNFVNPNEKKLRQEIEGAFSPKIKAVKPGFQFSQVAKPNVTLLANILKI
jgi:hypothetical protein